LGFIGGAFGVRILTYLSPNGENNVLDGSAYRNKSKLEVLFGQDFFDQIRGKTVIDFGCGVGDESIEMVGRGAAHVTGVDIRRKFIDEAEARACSEGLSDRLAFRSSVDTPADVIVSLDGFEHYDDPAGVLETMAAWLKPGGKVLVSFGCTWYHPYGGHLFALFPWAHLLFTERAMLTWRKQSHPEQHARTVKECGLNKMTIRRFEQLVAQSPFTFARYETRPIRQAQRLHLWNHATREFFTSIVQATLVLRAAHVLPTAGRPTDRIASVRTSPAPVTTH
jgi:2-polyprenyl-3-methyl-5-hydroxy-6-metoxy-1,4-benzoquinol methylase